MWSNMEINSLKKIELGHGNLKMMKNNNKWNVVKYHIEIR